MSAAPFCAIPTRAVFNAGLCAAGAYAFSTFSPAAAAVFGALSSVTRNGLRACVLGKDDGFFNRNIKIMAVYAASAGAASWCMNLVGIPVTFNAAAGLTGLMYVTSCIITPIVLGCICCTGIAAILYGVSQGNTPDADNLKNQRQKV